MNNLSNATITQDHHSTSSSGSHRCYNCCKPIPALAIFVLIPLLLIGLGFSIFILAVVHNALFFVLFLLLSALIAAFVVWNSVNWRRNGAVHLYLQSFPESDLRFANHGDLVKITGLVSCGSISLESSYEKVKHCVYTSTLLFEFGELGLKVADANWSWFRWRLAYSERFSTDFYITDRNSGVRAMVKAGPGCKVLPLVTESRLVNTTRKQRVLSSHLKKWLRDRNLPTEARLLRLEEGYIKEGSSVSVIGMLHRNSDAVTIVQPPQLMSTGCLWRKLLVPVDIDGLILGLTEMTDIESHPHPVQRVEQ